MSTKPQSPPIPDFSEIVSVETITGLSARYIPPTNAQQRGEEPDGCASIRCQLGRKYRVQESGILPGNKGKEDHWTADYFKLMHAAGSWGEVIKQWKKATA